MAAGFKKRQLSAVRVAEVEKLAANSPIVGDPRIGGNTEVNTIDTGVTNKLGSSQDSVAITKYVIGQVYDVPLELVKSNPFNPRVFYPMTAIEDMIKSISEKGQQIAATGYAGEGAEVFLIEGETRFRALRALGKQTLRIEIRPKPDGDKELYEAAREINIERNDQTPLDDAIKWKELLDKKIYPTQSSLAKSLRIGEDQVSRILSLAMMPSRIIQSLSENYSLCTAKMLNAIREYWAIAGDDETLKLILEIETKDLGYRDVVNRRKAASNGPVKRTRSTKDSIKYFGAVGEFKSFEEEGRVEFSMKGLTQEQTHEITNKIKALFNN